MRGTAPQGCSRPALSASLSVRAAYAGGVMADGEVTLSTANGNFQGRRVATTPRSTWAASPDPCLGGPLCPRLHAREALAYVQVEEAAGVFAAHVALAFSEAAIGPSASGERERLPVGRRIDHHRRKSMQPSPSLDLFPPMLDCWGRELARREGIRPSLRRTVFTPF